MLWSFEYGENLYLILFPGLDLGRGVHGPVRAGLRHIEAWPYFREGRAVHLANQDQAMLFITFWGLLLIIWANQNETISKIYSGRALNFLPLNQSLTHWPTKWGLGSGWPSP